MVTNLFTNIFINFFPANMQLPRKCYRSICIHAELHDAHPGIIYQPVLFDIKDIPTMTKTFLNTLLVQ